MKMDESEENISAEDIQNVDNAISVKIKPKKRSLVERELETNLTARVTSPVTSEGSSTSRYGRARRLKTGVEETEKIMKPLKIDVSKTQPQAYKMHASNSPVQKESPKRAISVGSSIEDQIENIYNENISLSRFGSEEKAKSQSPAKKFSKVYIRKDLIQKPDTDTVVLIKNMFSPNKSNSHLNNILERSSEKYSLNGHGKAWNGFPDTSSVVKTLDFDENKKKKDVKEKVASKNELFDVEASCEYQVGDLAWGRVGTYPFWPCIVTREPYSDMFVKKKLFGRVERAVIHVTFFGDNGRRGWIMDNMLRKYHGRTEFEAAREKFTPEAKKKDLRLYAAHFVSEKKLALWNVSVDEAETLMKEPKRLRIDALYDMLERNRAVKTTPKRERGGKITRTDSDVSLSESLYDTLFSEDDGKTDDNNRAKKARNKSLDVSEVVTACLDNMAAKSGIIQIQRQSHMDRWLQKAKSKTPEKIQPRLQVKVEKEKRKDKVKKKAKEGKKPHKLRKNESLGSESNLLPFQNEHDYSSVNYENHDINDSSNKNTDSASGHDSTLDSSGIAITIKVESLSNSMEDCSQDDIITTVVNDDMVMTETENISKGVNEDKNHTDNMNNRIEHNKEIENNNEHNLEISKTNVNEQIESPVNNSDLTNSVQPRRSKRKRQTFEGLNNSIPENKAKEPKLNLEEPKIKIDVTTPNCSPDDNEIQENFLKTEEASESTKIGLDQKIDKESSASNLEIDTSHPMKQKLKQVTGFNNNFKPVVLIEPLRIGDLETHIIVKQSKLLDSIIQNTENNSKAPDSSTFHSETVDNCFEKSASQTTNLVHVNINKVDIKPDAARLTRSNDVRSKQNQCDISTDCKQHAVESTIDSERMEVDNCATLVAAEKDKTKNFTSGVITSEMNADPIKTLDTDVANKPTAEVFKVPLVQEHKKTVIDNNGTNVVIGEETFIFDRTLSQDYDEINADQYDEKNKSPTTSTNKKGKDTHLDPTKPEELALENDQNIKSDTESTECVRSSNDEDDLTTKNNCASPHAPTNDLNSLNVLCDPGDSCIVSNAITKKDTNSDVPLNCIFLDKGNIDNESKVTTPEDNRLSSATSNVSNVINEEQNEVSKQITEDNNSKCVFLDKSTDMTNAPLNNSTDRKQKSPRLSLNRAKYRLLKLHNKNGEIQKETLEHNIKKVNTSPNRSDLKIASPNSDDSEASDKHKGRTIEKQDTKKSMNDPEFIKYLEIRQDALIDEQPDLTQDEIATYLYQNWLYEENNKSDIKKLDDTEQSNLVKGLKQEVAPQPKKIRLIRKKSDDVAQSNSVKGLSREVAPQPKKIRLIRKKSEKDQESKSVDIRSFMQKEQPARVSDELKKESYELTSNVPKLSDEVRVENIENRAHDSKDSIQTTHVKLNDIDDSKLPEIRETRPDESDSLKQNDVLIKENIPNNVEVCVYPKLEEETKNVKILSDKSDSEVSESLASSTDGTSNLNDNNASGETKEKNGSAKIKMCTDTPITDKKSVDLKQSNVIELKLVEELKGNVKHVDLEISDQKESKDPTKISKLNGFIENKEVNVESKTNDEFDPETASFNSEDSGVSMTRRRGRPKEKQSGKMAMDDPEFVKYLETRQDALIDEQPDLTQDEIVTYLYQTWFYEESNKSELKKTDDNEQSNLVKGLNQEPAPQPKKIKKKSKTEKEPQLKNVDIRVMIQKEKPKRKATQSKPYYNEEDSDLEEEDLETFKIFDRSEEDVEGEEIDEVELYFEKLTKPKPNVFKGYVRERVCEICEIAGSLVKCKSCHGTFHVNCVKKEAEVTEVAAPTRGRKRKRGRKPKGYDSLLDSESQSDERSQDANNSEELNMSLEEEAASHIVIDADNFENQWELKIKELQTDDKEEYASDQEINWEVEPGQCEIVDIKQKEKPKDYSDYKCNNCLKYDTPVCFVCKSNKSPKTQTEVRQKCQVAHCHRYYHLECLDHWPQTQFNSWEPSKTNKKVIEYIEALSCPRHVCHTCVSDDPRGCKTRFCGDKLARCVKCPATYHSYTKCLPAGSQILTGSQIICPRHYEHRPGKVPCHVNTGWCFICALGGTLICCEYCPTSFHAECLNIKPPEGSYMCEDCETGRLPLYGEMVWVKLGHYRWWPGIVLHPTEIPDNIMAVKHSPGEFVVRFFGQYDHYWVNRGRVFPFQEGDSGRISSQKSKIDAAFTTAMEHAQRACEILKKMEPNEEEDMDIASSLLPPHYVKLKVNKPLGVARRDADANSLTQCDCDPSQPDPCGPYSHCLNRMLLTECGPLCRAGDRCNNRAFEKRLYPRLAAYRTPQRGWGLRTLEDIKQGQFVIEYVGELIDLEEFRRRMCRKHEIRDENFYFLTLDKERMIDAGPKGNLARFMNHCCEPNCETQKWTVLGDVRVGLFALRDIPANSEVTFNYNLECAGIEKKRCLCGAKRCSGYIGAKPKQLQDDLPKKLKPPAKRTYKKRKPVEDPTTSKTKILKIKIKPIKPRELTEIEKDLLIIKSATNGMSSDSEGSRLSSVDEKNPKALKRKRVSFSTDEVSGKKAKLAEDEVAE